ncbi:MAG: hypothetical protein HYY07_01600 [Elusimicrobia bacterium]|nr:hypothetical protein [Elusimicrobiota bacterium]
MAITSCKRGGDSPPSALPEPSTSATFTQVYSIFSGAGCLTGGCHGASAAPLMNSQSSAYSNMVGKTSNCSGKTYVVSGNSSASYLIEKIASNPSCGSRMPQGNASYFDSNSSQLQTIKDWINDGAQNNY